MSGLDQIQVRVEGAHGDSLGPGQQGAVLQEVRHALQRLLESGEETKIDLNSLPFGPGDLTRLEALLGEGEVRAEVDALGPTQVRETSVPGVWLIDYRNSEGQRLALHIEIARVPEILRPPPQDLDQAIAVLDARLEQGQGQLPPTTPVN